MGLRSKYTKYGVDDNEMKMLKVNIYADEYLL